QVRAASRPGASRVRITEFSSRHGAAIGPQWSDTTRPHRSGTERRGRGAGCWDAAGGSVEGVAAGAGPTGVRVIDGEALLLDGVGEVDSGAGQVRHAHLVHDHFDAFVLAHRVAVEHALVEVELVDQAGTATRLHGDAQTQV